jgi:hypothetical protein
MKFVFSRYLPYSQYTVPPVSNLNLTVLNLIVNNTEREGKLNKLNAFAVFRT